MILKEIIEHKKEQLKRDRRRRPLEVVMEAAARGPTRHGFRTTLVKQDLGLIAEVKKASPSAGTIRDGADILAIVHDYEAGGADCVSVLTEERYFQGSIEDLSEIRNATPLPLLRKDFLFDEYHLYEARAAGADAVLLISSLFSASYLRDLVGLAQELDLEALIEVHQEDEVERACSTEAEMIGINNRDLKTMEIDLEVTARLRPRIPQEKLVVSESGVRNREDVEFLRAQGIDALLIGETLMKSDDIQRAMAELGLQAS